MIKQPFLNIQKRVIEAGVKVAVLLMMISGVLHFYKIETGFVQVGLWVLGGTQLIRLTFVNVQFLLQKEFFWVLISSFVMFALSFSLFFHTTR